MIDPTERLLIGIPTRNRPEYLAALLSTILFQTHDWWDLLIVDTNPSLDNPNVDSDPQVFRLLKTIKAMGHSVKILRIPANFPSEVTAVNRILVEASLGGYTLLYKIDDDHLLPPKALEVLSNSFRELQESDPTGRFILSGLTPWMHEAWKGAAGPGDVKDVASLDTGGEQSPFSSMVLTDSGIVEFTVNHFYRWELVQDGDTKEATIASAANFMMEPDCRILWSDIGMSSLHADAIWFHQLQTLCEYRLFFNLSVHAWHVAAPSGGVRLEEDQYLKHDGEDTLRSRLLAQLLRGER